MPIATTLLVTSPCAVSQCCGITVGQKVKQYFENFAEMALGYPYKGVDCLYDPRHYENAISPGTNRIVCSFIKTSLKARWLDIQWNVVIYIYNTNANTPIVMQ